MIKKKIKTNEPLYQLSSNEYTLSKKKIFQPGKIVIQVTIKAKKCSGRQEQPQNYFSATIHMTKVIKR